MYIYDLHIANNVKCFSLQVAISQYIGDLLARISDMLITAWGTDKFSIPTEMEAPYIKMIRLPDLPGYPPSGVS